MKRVKVIVDVPAQRDRRWKSWAKSIKEVDQSRTNGYAFVGEFLTRGRKAELEVGGLVLLYDEIGSRKHRRPEVRVLRVEENGALSTVLEAHGWSWALELRDKVAELLGKEKESQKEDENPLAGFSTEQLLAELRRRGLDQH